MVDMNKFLPVYFEESEEKLVLLEAGLRRLALGEDAEVLEQTARAVHSIKGSSGTFGFEDVCDLAWAIEDVLRHVVKGQLALDARAASLCLEATALLREAIQAHRDRRDPPGVAMKLLVARLKAVVAAEPVDK